MKMKKSRIFLVDDDKDDQQLFKEAFLESKCSAELKIYKSGLELMSAISSEHSKPDMIFLDLYMPGMDGEECLEALRKNSKFDNVPIVIYSTEFDIDRIAKLFSIGANRYLKKPDSFKSLVASIQTSVESLRRNALGGTAIINIVT
ncbi:response regulator [Cytophaga sp. FL35]|uniref:response regulator n=1 Tax=Cytophaga sp. FL35 TaxID=1904456 RepID=UPI0016535B9D|nr:response regulator [Cytophaga sp. FL35]MBC7000745.1 response regulator [Cytophaga sp. FL35]